MATWKAVAISLSLGSTGVEDARRMSTIFCVHTLCVKVTREFLKFFKTRGNSLVFTRPGFPGFKTRRPVMCMRAALDRGTRGGKALGIYLEFTITLALEGLALESQPDGAKSLGQAGGLLQAGRFRVQSRLMNSSRAFVFNGPTW